MNQSDNRGFYYQYLEIGRETFVFQAINSSIGGHLYFWDFGNDSNKTLTFLQEVQMSYVNQGEYEVMMVAYDDSFWGYLCNDTIIKIVKCGRL